jgi:hypothetical protein
VKKKYRVDLLAGEQEHDNTKGNFTMDELRINILDANRAVNCIRHASIAHAALAALRTEPETIEELEDAMARFIKPLNNGKYLDGCHNGIDEELWDEGIVLIDLAARVCAGESTCSALVPEGEVPEGEVPEGEVPIHNDLKFSKASLPYCIPDDWLFVDSILEYRSVVEQRRAERAAVLTFDPRSVLYDAIAEFVVNECRSALVANREDPVIEIHAKWLMTPRIDLGGMPPREILLMKRKHLDRDMESRKLHWSRLNEPAPCLSKTAFAYRFAGFGTHEIVVYYDLVRMLITDCWKRMNAGSEISTQDEISRLEGLKADWLVSPNLDFNGNSPSCLIERERMRLPWLSSGEDAAFDDDCPLCQAMDDDTFGLCFWNLDGCNMENEFAFSFHRTREEWEEENRSLEEFIHSVARGN